MKPMADTWKRLLGGSRWALQNPVFRQSPGILNRQEAGRESLPE